MVRNCLIIALVVAIGAGTLVGLESFEIRKLVKSEGLNDQRSAINGQSPLGESLNPLREKPDIGSDSEFVSVAEEKGSKSGSVEEATRNKLRQDEVDSLAVEDTPPWPPGTEDRIYQAIAENSADIKITGIHSVECVGNLCTILLSIPDMHPTDTSEYGEIFSVLRHSDLAIGSSSIAFVDHESGFRLIRLAIDNVEWTDERLQRVRDAAAENANAPRKD